MVLNRKGEIQRKVKKRSCPYILASGNKSPLICTVLPLAYLAKELNGGTVR